MSLNHLPSICTRLQQNDPLVTVVEWSDCGANYGRVLGESLRDNFSIKEMSIRLDILLDNYDDVEAVNSNTKALRDYISDSTSLQRLNISCWERMNNAPNFDMLVMNVFKSIASNPNIQWLSFDSGFEVNVEAVSVLAKTSSSLGLKRLTVQLNYQYQLSPHPHPEAFSSSIASIHTLVYVEIDVANDCNPAEIKSLLHHLSSHRSLKTLKVKSFCSAVTLRSDLDNTIFASLSKFMHLTDALCHLVFQKFCMRKLCLEYLIQGLTRCASLRRLSFWDCYLDHEPANLLLPFLQSSDSCISKLELEIIELLPLLSGRRVYQGLLPVVTNTDSLDPNVRKGTCISLGGILYCPVGPEEGNDMACIINLTTEDKIQLRHLGYVNMEEELERDALYRCLPQQTYMRRLSVYGLSVAHGRAFMNVVRSNGSLHTVIGFDKRGHINAGSTDALAERDSYAGNLVRSYCQRNQYIPKLLVMGSVPREATIPKKALTSGGESSICARRDNTNNDGSCEPLIPTIFEVCKHAPRTAPNNVLLGLLGFRNPI